MRKIGKISLAVVFLLTVLCVVPFLYVFVKSLFSEGIGLTFTYYYEVFLAQSRYLFRFWKSLGLTLCIVAGQVMVSIFAGYGFAKCSFRGKNVLFLGLMILMIMPLQVTLVPNYMVLKEMGLLNTYYALVLPAVFVPLGTFIMTQSFRAVSDSVIEAARLDGCNTMEIIYKVAIPMNKSGLVCIMLLSFLDAWSMVEQPMVYLENFDMYPISVGLASSPVGDGGLQLVCCVLVMLPPLFLFAYFNRELVEGIAIGGEK